MLALKAQIPVVIMVLIVITAAENKSPALKDRIFDMIFGRTKSKDSTKPSVPQISEKHYQDISNVSEFTFFAPHPECNDSKTIPDNEWGPYYYDHLKDFNMSYFAEKALQYLNKSKYIQLEKNCPIKNKSLVYYYDSFVDQGAVLFVYACNPNRTNFTDYGKLEYVLIQNFTNTSDYQGYKNFEYSYSQKSTDFNVSPIQAYKEEVRNKTLVDSIYDYISLEIYPIVNFDIFTDRLCDTPSDRTERKIETKFENGFRYIKVRLACGYNAETMTYVELSQDVLDCYYTEGEVVFNGNSLLEPNPWRPKKNQTVAKKINDTSDTPKQKDTSINKIVNV